MLAVRKQYSAFGRGTVRFLRPANRKILAYLREHDGERILCVANVSRQAQAVELNLAEFAGKDAGGKCRAGRPSRRSGNCPICSLCRPSDSTGSELSDGVEPPAWSTATAGMEPEHLTFVLRSGVADVLRPGTREKTREYARERRPAAIHSAATLVPGQGFRL